MLLLREYFRAKKATPADICQRLGVPQPRVSEFLNGDRKMIAAAPSTAAIKQEQRPQAGRLGPLNQ
jgi:plasmid maintenance system antidote protein VapI